MPGHAWQAWLGEAWPDKVAPGIAGAAWRGEARQGGASQAQTGLERPGYKYPLPFSTKQNTMTATMKKQTAASAIRALAEKHGSITAEIVLKAAEKKTSPLHPHFDWNDTTAAREYRLIQAGALIRRIKVQYEVSEERTVTIRAFHNVTDESEDGSSGHFVTLDSALSVESYRDQMLANCKRDLQAFRQKYAALSEVSAIIKEIDKFAA